MEDALDIEVKSLGESVGKLLAAYQSVLEKLARTQEQLKQSESLRKQAEAKLAEAEQGLQVAKAAVAFGQGSSDAKAAKYLLRDALHEIDVCIGLLRS